MTNKLSLDELFIKKIGDIIEANILNNQFGVSELAKEIGLSRSQLHRKLRDINGKSPSQFIREYRLEKAMEMLKLKQGTASEISYDVGFSSPSYFNTSFHEFYGYTPGEVKNQKTTIPPKKTITKKLMSVIPVIILIAVIVFNELNKDSINNSNIEKSIAVLPFINNSSNEENMYFCNGIMAGIRDHLAKIPGFYVVSRLSVESYRNTSTPLKVIAGELDVNYLLEGHVQRIGDRAIISVELIRVTDNKILWSDTYDKDVSEIFSVQANVIKSISNNLETAISPKLKIELNTNPTQDKLAIDHYLKGEEYRFKADRQLQKNENWLELLNKAKLSYELAIERDSLFAQAYVGLASYVFQKNIYSVQNNDSLKKVPNILNKALQLNPNLESAYLLRGLYYDRFNKKEQAIKDYKKALEINPNNPVTWDRLCFLHIYDNGNFKDAVIALKNMKKYAKSKKELKRAYSMSWMFYSIMGQEDMVDYSINKSFENAPESYYHSDRVWTYFQSNRLDEALIYIEKKLTVDNQERNAILGFIYTQKKNNIKALEYWGKCYNQVIKEGTNSALSTIVYYEYGMALIRNGQIVKGKELMQKQIEVFNKVLSSENNFLTPFIYYKFIGLYAALGQYEKAYDYIEKFESVNGWVYWGGMVSAAKMDDQFDILRDDPVFKASLKRGEKRIEEVQNQIRPYLLSTPPLKID
jgi:TolB-like protein/AraC-like DNA-binding protein